MIPTIWLIDIWLINWWFMDGWPGWKREFKSSAELTAEHQELEARHTWTPAMAPGLCVGMLVGVAAYFGLVKLLPWASATFTLVK